MKFENFKAERAMLIILQALLLLGTLVNSVYQLISSMISSVFVFVPFLYIVCTGFLVFYAVYGFNHKDTSFRLACTLYIMAASVEIDRLLLLDNFFTLNGMACVVSLILMIIFSITFKHRQELSIRLGAIACLIRFVFAVLVCLSGATAGEILAMQPFSHVFIIGSLVLCLYARFHWRAKEKLDQGLIDDEEE